MALGTRQFFPTHPGQDGAQFASDMKYSDAHITNGRYAGGGFPANLLAALFSMNMFTSVGGMFPYASGGWTVTTTGTSAAAAQAATAGGGVKLTAGSDSTFNTNLQSIGIWTPVASKRVIALGRVQASDITTVGFEFNIGNSQVDPATTNYTDVVGIKMAVGAGTTVGKVRGNSGTEATVALSTLAATTDMFVGLTFTLNATAALVDGGFFMGSNLMTATYTPFTADQKSQAAAILTTPPSMYLNLHAKGSAGNPTVTYTSAIAGVEN